VYDELVVRAAVSLLADMATTVQVRAAAAAPGAALGRGRAPVSLLAERATRARGRPLLCAHRAALHYLAPPTPTFTTTHACTRAHSPRRCPPPRAPPQGVGGLLASRRGQDWEKLISWVHESDALGSELDWAINAISGAVSSAS
jgi:hypothetical protein